MSISSFIDSIIGPRIPGQATPEDYQKLLASFMGSQAQPAPPSPVTNQMQPFGSDTATPHGPIPGLEKFHDILSALPPQIGTKFLLDQVANATNPEQQQRTAAMQSRQKIADMLAKVQGAPPDFAPVNVSPQIVGEGVTGTRTVPNTPSTPSMPITPEGFKGFDYGGKVTQPSVSPELLRSLALQSFSTGGNPADITALMNIGKGEQFDLAKGTKRYDGSGNVIASNEAPPEPGKAPTTRTYDKGSNSVTEEYDPATGSWRKVADAPRKVPGSDSEANKPPAGYRWSANGTLEYIPGGPADPTKGAGKKAPTEDQAKNMQLYERASQQAKILLGDPATKTPGTYDALASKVNQIPRGILSTVTAGYGNLNAATGEQGQRADNALKDLAASYLYSVSGATANPGEVANLTDTLIPKLTDTPANIADKKARIQQMVDSIKTRSGGAEPQGVKPAPAAGATTSKTLNGVTYHKVNGQWMQ